MYQIYSNKPAIGDQKSLKAPFSNRCRDPDIINIKRQIIVCHVQISNKRHPQISTAPK